MQTIAVLQNTDAEHLGLIEDHLEGRNIRFRYIRPSHDPNWVENFGLNKGGLILLGAAPYGTVSSPRLSLLEKRVELVRTCVEDKLPILAFGTGAQLLVLASGGSVTPCELSLQIDTAYRTDNQALNGYLPEEYPIVRYMRDFANVPENAEILSRTSDGMPALYQLSDNCLAFTAHPGMKSAIIEDSIVQQPGFDVVGIDRLGVVRAKQYQLENALISMMTGIIQIMGWMR